ncbi:unnamed protein product [Microthlaspi erraticum]|uniref:Elicitor peptide 4 n=1 Tax=Microthlaspi erraticum TaxID=1685480 RepID=A0A6D2IJB1_9BRAS|nr:unnamed protein product [Microthlaspi erraticum]
MEKEGRREDGVSSYLCIPFSFIHKILQSLLFKSLGLKSPPISNEEEETEVVKVSSRKIIVKQDPSSGKPGGTNKSRA